MQRSSAALSSLLSLLLQLSDVGHYTAVVVRIVAIHDDDDDDDDDCGGGGDTML
jgi:hypothetical protein